MNNKEQFELKEKEEVIQQYRKKIDIDEYYQIREEYKSHSIAEENHSIEGLMATLTDDCEYILVQSGHTWKGKKGATEFYTHLLTAFPDIDFQLQNIVIGPQGVFQEAFVSGTHKNNWLGFKPTDKKLNWNTLIFFPWDSEKKKFKGERVYSTLTDEMLQ
jgi:predicted ester cyclase